MILHKRLFHKQGKDVSQVLVQGQGLPSTTTTWEDKEEFKQAYPDYNIEDKVEVDEGSTDRKKNGAVQEERDKQQASGGNAS